MVGKKMEILIEQITEEGLVFEFEKSVENFPVLAEMAASGECKFAAPIGTILRAQRIGDMVEIDGDIETSVHLPCSRCLQSFQISLKSRFAVTYMRRAADGIEDSEHQEVELSAEDTGIVYFQGEKINLKDTIQEQVVLEFPIRALCKQDCKGLCPKCGSDLNQNLCDCDHSSSPGRFDVLKYLKVEK